MTTNGIPVFDLQRFESADPQVAAGAARELDEICREIGFLVISNHGVAESTQRALYDAGRSFFDLPMESKMTVRRPHHAQNRGYIPYGEETLARMHGGDTPPDFKEVFAIGPFDRPDDEYHSEELSYPNFAPNLWPGALPALEPAMKAYFLAVEDLSRRLARCLALALGLPSDWFADKLDRHGSQLRLLHYPAPSQELEPGQLRCGVHTDLGMMTILRNEAAVGGLQVRPRGSDWIDAPAIHNTFIVNIGDLLMRWTNDRWVSTPHRVAVPDRWVSTPHRVAVPQAELCAGGGATAGWRRGSRELKLIRAESVSFRLEHADTRRSSLAVGQPTVKMVSGKPGAVQSEM